MPVRFARTLTIALVSTIGFAGSIGIPGEPMPLVTQVASASASAKVDREECRVLGKINAYRRKKGLNPVVLERDLTEAASYHSEHMARHNYFSHTLKGGKGWDENIRSFGYKGDPISENIFAGSSDAGDAFDAWKKSRGHRKTMLDRSYRAIGIGRAFDKQSKYGWYWTTTFGGSVDNRVNCR